MVLLFAAFIVLFLAVCALFGVAMIVGMVAGIVEIFRGRTTTAGNPPEQWPGVHGGVIDGLYVGAHVINQADGTGAQILALLEDDWAVLRCDDDQVRCVHLSPADSQAA
jgi:hypothetical protein